MAAGADLIWGAVEEKGLRNSGIAGEIGVRETVELLGAHCDSVGVNGIFLPLSEDLGDASWRIRDKRFRVGNGGADIVNCPGAC